jgi:hypothetical protein
MYPLDPLDLNLVISSNSKSDVIVTRCGETKLSHRSGVRYMHTKQSYFVSPRTFFCLNPKNFLQETSVKNIQYSTQLCICGKREKIEVLYCSRPPLTLDSVASLEREIVYQVR